MIAMRATPQSRYPSTGHSAKRWFPTLLVAVALTGCAGSAIHSGSKTAKSGAGRHDASPKAGKEDGKSDVVFTIVSDFSPTISGPIERRARTGQTRGHERSALPFQVADLPTSVLSESLEDKDAPSVLDGNAAPEISVTRSSGYAYGYTGASTYNTVMVSSSELTTGTIRVGPQEGTFSKANGTPTGGLVVQCAPWGRVVSTRWEGLHKKTATQNATYEIVDGWFDMKQCRAVAVRRSQIALTEIIPDTLYAFRQCADFSCSERTSVSFVLPNATNAVSQNGPLRGLAGTALQRFLMPVKKGSSESVMALVPAVERSSKPRTVEIEISQGTADEQPLATAFIETAAN